MITRRALVALAAVTALLTAAGCGGGFNTTAPAERQTQKTFANYVALGDGFASAPYLGPDESGSGCLRSATNYPTLVAQALGVSQITDVTCVGATTADLTAVGKPPGSETRLLPQLKAVSPETDLVTLGIGLEDNGLLRSMFRICEQQPCGDDVPAPTIQAQLDSFGDSLAAAIRTIQAIAPTAEIIVVGYPQIMPASPACDALPPMTEVQLSFAFAVLGKVNEFLRSAALQTGSEFIDVAALSAARHACSTDPWVRGAQTVPGKVQAFHPVAAEQRAVATAIEDLVRSTL